MRRWEQYLSVALARRLALILAVACFVSYAPIALALAAVDPDVQTLQPAQASSSKRIALVIGNAGYQNVTTLRNPVSDANAMGAALQSVGFKVILARNLDRRGMNETIDRFLAQVEPGNEALVYYSGHGIELNGSNYLLPVDVPGLDVDQERMLRAEGVNLSELLLDLEARSARVNLVILDACRDNPFRAANASGRTKSLGSERGLGRVEPPKGTFVIFAAGVGERAIDNIGKADTNPNGLFTRELLTVITKPGLEIRPMVQQLRMEVREASLSNGNGGQTPSYYDQLLGEFYFLPKSLEPEAQGKDADLCRQLVNPQASASEIINKDLDPALRSCAMALTDQPGELQFARFLQAAQEQSVFQKALGSPDPSLSSAYLILYPNGRFANDVKTHLASLQPTPEKVPVVPPMPDIDPKEVARLLQTELKRVGCDPGPADGSWGSKSMLALQKFAAKTGTDFNSTMPSLKAISYVRGLDRRICELVCSAGSSFENGECVQQVCRNGFRRNKGGVCTSVKPTREVESRPDTRKRQKREENACAQSGGYAYCY